MSTVLASADIIQICSTLDGYQELAGDFSELEKEKYFEWIVIYLHIYGAPLLIGIIS